MNSLYRFGVVVSTLAASVANAQILIVSVPDPDGLAAEAEFTFLNPTTLEVRLRNTSTGVPAGFDNADQILTGVSWDFGPQGLGGVTSITGGSVEIGPTSNSVNFDTGSYGPGTDVSGEYGFGNMNGTGALINFVSSNSAQATPFGGANLDGPANIDGPQGGLVASPILVPLGGLGAIQDEIIATLTLSTPYSEAALQLDFDLNGVRFEFGSDAAFLPGVPAPATVVCLVAAGVASGRRRR